MPEGVEVKLSGDLIRPIMFGVGKKINNVYTTGNSRYASEEPEGYIGFKNDLIKGCQVANISTRGKFMYWGFSNDWYMFCTFGMTGQWSPTAGKHPCIVFEYLDPDKDGMQKMVFNDPRHFGTIKFTNNPKDLTNKLSELGWDPLQMSFDNNVKWLTYKLSKTSKGIAEVLMDQSIFCGVGNYIRAEALYLSKLSPWRQANKLTKDEIQSLCQAIVTVMEESYRHQGATIQTYKTAYGEEGRYSTLFKVYGQKEDPSGLKIVKQQTPDKRTIHWCPEVQV